VRKVIAAGLAISLALTACSSDRSYPDVEQQVEELEQELGEATSTTSTTTTSTTTTSSTSTTTTTVPPTTIRMADLPEEQQQALIVDILEDQGIAEQIAALLMQDHLLASVDVVRYSPDDYALEIAVTSEFRSDEIVEDQAWEITRQLAAFWEEDTFLDGMSIPTHLRLDVSGGLYPCDHGYMLRLASLDMSRSEWSEACR
jgi:hypothetical protein